LHTRSDSCGSDSSLLSPALHTGTQAQREQVAAELAEVDADVAAWRQAEVDRRAARRAAMSQARVSSTCLLLSLRSSKLN
jgi:hypothetical protein